MNRKVKFWIKAIIVIAIAVTVIIGISAALIKAVLSMNLFNPLRGVSMY